MTEKRPNCPNCGKVMMLGKDTRGKRRWRCLTAGVYCYSTVGDPSVVKKQDGSTKKKGPPPKFKRSLDSKIFVVTSAQNATPLHDAFWKSLLQYCEFRGAELMVIPIRYKNATSRWTESQANAEWWLDAPVPEWDPAFRRKMRPAAAVLMRSTTRTASTCGTCARISTRTSRCSATSRCSRPR